MPFLAACEGTQSTLSPHGPAASSIAALAYLLFVLVAVVFAVVLAATWLAIRGSDRVRGQIAKQRTIIAGGVVFPVVVLTGLLIYGLWLMRADASAKDYNIRIDVSGEQWWWRVNYRLPDGRAIESANEIRLPVGQNVAVTLTSPDVIHSFWIPSLAGKMDMIPGRTTVLRLKANRAGIYRGACAEYCGGPHALMAIHALAVSQADFEAWLDTRLGGGPARNQEKAPGRTLFQSAGCGGCHAIDGTEAQGVIGPNLTDLGVRQSVGAGLLPMSQTNVSRFLVHGQRLKPGNKMPPFDIFSEGQLADLSSYLLSLK
jgi:cytochrome c oxidase subunit 2